MAKNYDPPQIHPPLGRYTHAVEVGPNTRLLTISGQVGIRPDGTLADDIESQLRQTWANIAAILGAAGMALSHIVKITTIVVRPEHLAIHPRIRSEVLGDHLAAATGFCTTALAKPELLCEIEVTAAAPASPGS